MLSSRRVGSSWRLSTCHRNPRPWPAAVRERNNDNDFVGPWGICHHHADCVYLIKGPDVIFMPERDVDSRAYASYFDIRGNDSPPATNDGSDRFTHPRMQNRSRGRERMLLVVPPKAKLSMRKETHIQALAELPLVLTTRPNSLRLAVDTGLAACNLQPSVRFEANTLPLMTDLVMADLGYTVLPTCGVRSLLKQGKVTASPIAGLFITWLVAKPRARSLSVAAERFYDSLRALAAKQVQRAYGKQHRR
jgi:hypothetical protein